MKENCCTPMTASPPGANDVRLAALAEALGHPARVAIMRYLHAQGQCLCGNIVDALPLAQATVSQHLKVLKDAGLIKGEVDGPRVCYCANPETLDEMKTLLNTL
jgi:ArsR family transcriptional regulator